MGLMVVLRAVRTCASAADGHPAALHALLLEIRSAGSAFDAGEARTGVSPVAPALRRTLTQLPTGESG
jgi:hypothetical protein